MHRQKAVLERCRRVQDVQNSGSFKGDLGPDAHPPQSCPGAMTDLDSIVACTDDECDSVCEEGSSEEGSTDAHDADT